ncbi:capsule assembly Wzi family protein, partial [Acinetobacter variabilis]
AVDVSWTHYLRPDIPLKLNGWISNSDLYGNDGGASIGIEFPLEKGLFSY